MKDIDHEMISIGLVIIGFRTSAMCSGEYIGIWGGGGGGKEQATPAPTPLPSNSVLDPTIHY